MQNFVTCATTATRRARAAAIVALVIGASPLTAAAQSLLDRPPNMQGAWVGRSGTVHFHFLHRFMSTDAPLRKVFNFPTFLLAASVPGNFLVGARYSTNSELVAQIPNEWELFARNSPLREGSGDPVTLSVHGGYNAAAQSWDGEVEVSRQIGAVRLLAAARGFSNAFDAGDARFAVAAGASVRLRDHVALAADYASLTDLEDEEGEASWSVGLQLGIPYTPHSLSLHASNASTTTLQGASVGGDRTRWGFEFTVPFTLSRYFGSRAGTTASPSAGGVSGSVAAEVGMNNQLRFTPDTVRIRVGETVRWTNSSDVIHTVTADPGRAFDASRVRLPDGASTFDSGDMAPGEVFEYTFTVAGEYRYICVPHELTGMLGVVIVEG
jgi:plastocyanin